MRLKIINIPPETIFIIIGLIYGLAFLFITPPFFVVPDEAYHFYKAYGISEGYVIPEKIGNEAGVSIPEYTLDTISASFNQKINFEDVINSKVNINVNKNTEKFVDMSRFAVVTYPPVPYAVSALAIKLGVFFDLSPFVLLYMARFANFLIWFFLVYLAIKIIPVHKWVLLMIALMPMTIFEAASVSADSLTIGLSFLFIAYILRLALVNHNFTRTDFLIICVLGVLLALTKSIYVFILFLFLLIPTGKFPNYKKKYTIFSIILIPISLLSVGWVFLTNNLYKPYIANWSLNAQLAFVLNHPLNYLILLIKSFISYWVSYLASFVGFLFVPFTFALVYFLILIFVAILDKNEFKLSLRNKLVSLMIVLSSVFVIMTFDYLTWNPIGNNFIIGVQGRYFIPIAPILLFLLYNKREYIPIFNRNFPLKMNNIYKLMIIATIVITLSFTLFMLFKFYHYQI